MRQKRTTALMMAIYKYSGRLTIRWPRNRSCQASDSTWSCMDNRTPTRRDVRPCGRLGWLSERRENGAFCGAGLWLILVGDSGYGSAMIRG